VPRSIACAVAMIAPKEWPSRAKASSPRASAIHVARPDGQRQLLRVDSIASALPALVDEEQTEFGRERVEPGAEHRVIEARTPVEQDQREALTDIIDGEAIAVGERDESHT